MPTTINRRPRRGFTLIELLVVVAILGVIMSMVGYIMVKAIEIKSVSENRLDDLIGGLAAGRLLDRDLRAMPDYADPNTPPGVGELPVYFLDRVTLNGAANQPVLYLKTTPDRFDAHNGDTEYVRWYVIHGILCRERLNLTTKTWLDLDAVVDLDLLPYEVLRGVAWTVELLPGDPTQIEVVAEIYPSMGTHDRIVINGDPPESLANNERPRSVRLQYQLSRAALAQRAVQEGVLWP